MARYEPTAPPFELWTFELGPEALTVRVDPISGEHAAAWATDGYPLVLFGYEVPPGRPPSVYTPSFPPSVPRRVGPMFPTGPSHHSLGDHGARLREETLSGAICSAATGYRCPLASRDLEATLLGEEGRRCGCTSAAGGLDLRGLYDHLRHKARFDGNGLHRTVLGALAERLAAAPGMLSDYLVQTLENDFPHLIERQRCTFCRGLYEGDGYTHATLSAELCQSCAAAVARTIADDSATVVATP